MTAEEIEELIYDDGITGFNGHEYKCEYTKAQRVQMIKDYALKQSENVVLDGVVQQSELLVCPECQSTDCKTAIHTDYKECNKCFHYWEAN